MKVIQEGGLKKRKVVSSRKGLSGREVEVRSSENDKAVDSFFWGTRQDQWRCSVERERTRRSLLNKKEHDQASGDLLSYLCIVHFLLKVYKENNIIPIYIYIQTNSYEVGSKCDCLPTLLLPANNIKGDYKAPKNAQPLMRPYAWSLDFWHSWSVVRSILFNLSKLWEVLSFIYHYLYRCLDQACMTFM